MRMILSAIMFLVLGAGEVYAAQPGAPAGSEPDKHPQPQPVPYIQAADYGQLLPASSAEVGLWWTHATRKISRTRPLPERMSAQMEIASAKGEYEPVQLVVRPTRRLRRLRASVGELTSKSGTTISPEHVKILRVYYVNVRVPSDKTATAGLWPDPLPALGSGVDVPAGANQPLWILVHVPENAAAGDYMGNIVLHSDGWSAKAPLHLHVWNFTLPRQTHVTTAFGFSPQLVFRYHRLKSEQQKRRVLDMYWRSFAEHRISPYDPAPLDPIRVHFTKQLDVRFDFTAWDKAMQRAFKRYRFNSFRLRLRGMGGGSFHNRFQPLIAGHKVGSPEYTKLFADYVGKLQEHLRQRGWLDKAYVYWFDEPQTKDYEFVKQGMARLKKYAPQLPRMLTEQVEPELTGFVDIWCAMTPYYDHKRAQARRKYGEKFWWYVCTYPRGHWCTLFIDHPATELRVWLWQTWQRNIDGILVWRTNYWTSSAAFPNSLQNPWKDPMSYVSGYSTPAGVKKYWGNGDGRFIYPPIQATGGQGKPVMKGPVSSIRWEMLREGIEDYEYLYTLRQLLRQQVDQLNETIRKQAESLLQVPPEITSDVNHFTIDGDAIYTHRAKVAEMIEKLNRNSQPPPRN